MKNKTFYYYYYYYVTLKFIYWCLSFKILGENDVALKKQILIRNSSAKIPRWRNVACQTVNIFDISFIFNVFIFADVSNCFDVSIFADVLPNIENLESDQIV
jgi:hypothetical protein